jgi:CHAT domain-containing protein
LQAAQRQALHNQPYSHPAYWGAFQLIGDPAPLSQFLTS